jgi:hypothetical protein
MEYSSYIAHWNATDARLYAGLPLIHGLFFSMHKIQQVRYEFMNKLPVSLFKRYENFHHCKTDHFVNY